MIRVSQAVEFARVCRADQVADKRGELETRKFSVFYFREGRLVAIDSVNRPGDYVLGRKPIATRFQLTPEQASDVSFDLKGLTSTAAR